MKQAEGEGTRRGCEGVARCRYGKYRGQWEVGRCADQAISTHGARRDRWSKLAVGRSTMDAGLRRFRHPPPRHADCDLDRLRYDGSQRIPIASSTRDRDINKLLPAPLPWGDGCLPSRRATPRCRTRSSRRPCAQGYAEGCPPGGDGAGEVGLVIGRPRRQKVTPRRYGVSPRATLKGSTGNSENKSGPEPLLEFTASTTIDRCSKRTERPPFPVGRSVSASPAHQPHRGSCNFLCPNPSEPQAPT